MPFLGKAQFEIIAEASEEFDKYLKNTLGGTDADIARREQMRSDYFGVQSVGKAHTTPRTSVRPRKRNAKDPESDLEVFSDESESDEDEEDDDEEDEEDILGNDKQSKATASSSSKSAATGGKKEELGDEDMDMEEFKRFKKFQKMGKK